MQDSKLARFLAVAAVTLVTLIIVVLIVNAPMDFQRAQFTSYIEISFTWILRFTGLSLLIFSIVSFLMSGSNFAEIKNFSKWAILILLSILIMHPAWYLIFGVVIILVTLIIIEFLNSSKKSIETQKPE